MSKKLLSMVMVAPVAGALAGTLGPVGGLVGALM